MSVSLNARANNNSLIGGFMKNAEKIEKDELRRYLDDIYTQEEGMQLLEGLRNSENATLIDEVVAEVWEESACHTLSTSLEKEKYKKEARRLLKRIEHRKRTWLQRMVVATGSVAAVIIVLIGSVKYLNYMNEQELTFTEVSTSFGEKKQINLPDGSMLVLNSCSQVRYPESFLGDTRCVELEGEGYFRIVRNEDAPFIVKTRRFDVQVLGTQFDVKSYSTDEIVSVSVESGEVQVDLPEAMMRLTAKQQILINTVTGEYSKRVGEEAVALWREGGLLFQGTPIKDVAKELERVYNCRITFASGQGFENNISGEHDNKSLEAVLESIAFISGIKYKKEGREILLYKE